MGFVMKTVFDVAAFIVARTGSISPMKLQKLVYYAQAWSLVRGGGVLFDEPIQAWRYGPVCPQLYEQHRGADAVPVPYPLGDQTRISPAAQQTIVAVLRAYGKKSSPWLSDLTHREDPWKNARGSLPLEARSTTEITLEAMLTYYRDAESAEKRQILSFGTRTNSLVSFIENLNEDDAAVIDELAELDARVEVAKLTV